MLTTKKAAELIGREPTVPQPSLELMMQWESGDGGCESTDGCWVEPDGQCEHGYPSWLLYLGLI